VKEGGAVKAVDRWTLGHFLLGLYLGMSGMRLCFAVAFLLAWELYEVLFRTDVEEPTANRVVDVVVGVLGAALGGLVPLPA